MPKGSTWSCGALLQFFSVTLLCPSLLLGPSSRDACPLIQQDVSHGAPFSGVFLSWTSCFISRAGSGDLPANAPEPRRVLAHFQMCLPLLISPPPHLFPFVVLTLREHPFPVKHASRLKAWLQWLSHLLFILKKKNLEFPPR